MAGPSAVVLGEPLVVLAPEQAGSLSEVRRFRTYLAGAEANVAVGLARLGVRVHFWGRVGQDPFGRLIRRELAAEQVQLQGLQEDEARPTGLYVKERPLLGSETRAFYYRKASAGAAVVPEAFWPQVLAGTQVAHVSGITAMLSEESYQTTRFFLRSAAQAGIPVAFTINLRLKLGPLALWQQRLQPFLQEVGVLFAEESECRAVFGVGGEALVLGGHGPGHVVLTAGRRGAVLYGAGQEPVAVPAFDQPWVVDTVGAGDGFVAGYLAGWLRGLSDREAMRLGSLVGAYAVGSGGDSEGYPRWEEAMAHLQGEWGVTR